MCTIIFSTGSNPTFLTTADLSESNGSLLKLTVRNVIEPLSGTSIVMGSANCSLDDLKTSPSVRLPILSLWGEQVGFVSLTSFVVDDALNSSQNDLTASRNHRRSISLPSRVMTTNVFKPPSECPYHVKPITASYRFQSGNIMILL